MLALVTTVGWYIKVYKPTVALKTLSLQLLSEEAEHSSSFLETLGSLSDKQKKLIMPAVLRAAEKHLENSRIKNDVREYQQTNHFLKMAAEYYPTQRYFQYLLDKEKNYQSEYVAERIVAFNALFQNWPYLSEQELEKAAFLRQEIVAIQPSTSLSQDHRLDYSFAKQIETAISADEKQHAELLLKQAFTVFPQSIYLLDLQDKYLLASRWSEKHYPGLLSDEWLLSVEHVSPESGVWLQKQPVIRQLQERLATHYLDRAQKLAEQQRYYLAIATLDKARHFASNIPSVELTYEVEKKRYDLFLVERRLEENKISQTGVEHVFQALLEINAIPQAEQLLAQQDTFSEEFIQTQTPQLIKQAYARLAAFTQMQQDYETDLTMFQASLGYPQISIEPIVALASTQEKLLESIIQNNSRQTYISPNNAAKKDIFHGIKNIILKEAQPQLDLLLYGHDRLFAMTELPIINLEEEPATKEFKPKPEIKAVALALPVKNKVVTLAEKPKSAVPATLVSKPSVVTKTPVDRLAEKLVETTSKYTGKDQCAKAWYEKNKSANVVGCRDRIVGTDQPMNLLVVTLNNDIKRLYAISENPISIGDYNRYCLLSKECQPRLSKASIKKVKDKKELKKDRDLPEAGLDLSDVQETIEEYDHFCILSGNCPGVLAEQNNLPITGLSQTAVQKYVAWLSKITGNVYRLPFVEEWLYVVRANGNYQCTSNTSLGVKPGLVAVGSGAKSPLGMRHQLNTMAEWVVAQRGTAIIGPERPEKLPECQLPINVTNESQTVQKTGFHVVREIKSAG